MLSAEDLALLVLGVSDGVDGLDDGTVGGGVCAGAGCVAKGVAATGVAAALADDWLAANWQDCCTAGWIYLKEKKIYYVLHWNEQKKKKIENLTWYAFPSFCISRSSGHWR